jgi:hypothetical protein
MPLWRLRIQIFSETWGVLAGLDGDLPAAAAFSGMIWRRWLPS